jgi:DNA mismatch endonuclease, patch repair protein
VKRHKYKSRLINPPPSSEAVRHSMQANRAKDTKPELILRKTLWSCGLRGYRLHSKNVPGRPDISFGKQKVAIFVHGCFWHRCPACKLPLPKSNRDFWIKKFRRNQSRDRRKAKALVSRGWRVFVIWECKLKRDMSQTVRRLGLSLFINSNKQSRFLQCNKESRNKPRRSS